MTYLLFLDESGHDHKNTPYEIRGGVALPLDVLWQFVLALRDCQREAFGAELATFPPDSKGHAKEIKGKRLLDNDRFKWAQQESVMPPTVRRNLSNQFLSHPAGPHTREEFTAYGQACLHCVGRIFELLKTFGATVFAIATPQETPKPPPEQNEDFLRRDYVYLLERYFYFLEEQNAQGLLIMDRAEDTMDRRLTRNMRNYFVNTVNGRERAQRILPTPFFVPSDITSLVQVADVVIYCINWGYRLPSRGMDKPTRPDIETRYAADIRQLLWHGRRQTSDGALFETYSIQFVPNLYSAESA